MLIAHVDCPQVHRNLPKGGFPLGARNGRKPTGLQRLQHFSIAEVDSSSTELRRSAVSAEMLRPAALPCSMGRAGNVCAIGAAMAHDDRPLEPADIRLAKLEATMREA